MSQVIPFHADAFAVGHQWKRVCRWRVFGSAWRIRHRSATTSIISSRVGKYRFATASFTKGHTRSTGFGGGWEPVAGLFAFDGPRPLLTEEDESTLTPGLFLSGPKVNHLNTAFCFIYKFRARFPVVAQAIARRMGLDEGALEVYRNRGMWADDLAACCTGRCAC